MEFAEHVSWFDQSTHRNKSWQRTKANDKMLLQFTEDEFMRLGLSHCGFSDKTINRLSVDARLDRFKDKYYIPPSICSTIYHDIQTDNCVNKIVKPKPLHLLLALFYLKKYPTGLDAAGFLDSCENAALAHSKGHAQAIEGSFVWHADQMVWSYLWCQPTNQGTMTLP